MAKKAIVVLAEGFEDIEAVTPIDVLRRAGVDVRAAGLNQKVVTGARGVRVETDCLLKEVGDLPDLLVLPGGLPGAKNLGHSKDLKTLIQKMQSGQRLIGAICAAPALALAPAGVLDGKRATCYPGFEKNFSEAVCFSTDRVIQDMNIVTSRGPGTALEFSLSLVKNLIGAEKAEEIRSQLLVETPVS